MVVTQENPSGNWSVNCTATSRRMALNPEFRSGMGVRAR